MAAQGEVFRIAARMQGTQGQDIINVWHAQIETYVTGSDLDVADELVIALSVNYSDLEDAITDEQSGIDISVQNVTQGTVQGTQSWNPSFDGTLTGDTMPPQTSLYAFFRTGLARRLGRKFFGIVNEASQDGGLVTGVISTIMNTFLAHWIGDEVGGGYRQYVHLGHLQRKLSTRVRAVRRSRHSGATENSAPSAPWCRLLIDRQAHLTTL